MSCAAASSACRSNTSPASRSDCPPKGSPSTERRWMVKSRSSSSLGKRALPTMVNSPSRYCGPSLTSTTRRAFPLVGSTSRVSRSTAKSM